MAAAFARPKASTVVQGTSFVAEVGRDQLRLTLEGGRKKTVSLSRITSAELLYDGRTKISLQLGRDIHIPTTRIEAAQLVKTLNRLISERRTLEIRRKRAAREERRKADKYRNRAGTQKLGFESQGFHRV